MSNSVDTRVVEMLFDNKQFESATKTSMGTIEKLKQALNFDGATKGLSELSNTTTKNVSSMNKSISSIDFSPFSDALEAIQRRLSIWGIAGATIISNFTTKMMSAIGNLGNGIKQVFGQISSGGLSRALNLESAQFQLEGLKIAWDDIKPDILYGVKDTAYGLDAAAKAAAQLSASSIKTGEDMKTSLRAISGVAAMTNSSYEDMARIFTGAAGKGKMMGDELMSLSARGLNVAAALKNYFNDVNSGAQETSDEVLKSIKKITNGAKVGEDDIRELASKRLIDYKIFAKAMDDLYGKQAAMANKTYTGALSNVKAALSRIGADVQANHLKDMQKIFAGKDSKSGLIALIDIFHDKLAGVITQINRIENILSNRIIKVIDYLRSKTGQKWITTITDEIEALLKYVIKLGKTFEKVFLAVFNINKKTLGSMRRGLLSFFKDFNKNFLNKNNIEKFRSSLTKVLVGIKNIAISFKTFFSTIKTFVKGILKPSYDIIISIFKITKSFINAISVGFKNAFGSSLLEAFRSVLIKIQSLIVSIARTLKDLVDAGFTTYFVRFIPLFQGLFIIIKNLGTIFGFIFNLLIKNLPKVFKISSEQETVFQKILDVITKLVKKFGDFLVSLDGFGSKFNNKLTKVFSNATPVIDKFKAALIKIRSTIKDVINWFKGLKDGVKSVEKPITVLKNFFKSLEPVLSYFKELFSDIITEIRNAVSGLRIGTNGNTLLGFVTLFNTALLGLGGVKVLDVIKKTFKATDNLEGIFGKLQKLASNIKKKIGDAVPIFGRLEGVLKSYQQNINSKTIFTIAKSVALLAGSLWLVSTIDSDKLDEVFTVMAGSISGLVIALYAINKIDFKKTLNLQGVASVLISLGGAVALLAISCKILSEIDPASLTKAVTAISVLFVGLGTFLKYANFDKKGAGIKTSITLIALAASIKILASALVTLSEVDGDKIFNGLVAISGVMAAFIGLTNFIKTDGIVKAGLSMVIVASSLLIFAKAIEQLGSMNPDTLTQGLFAMAAALTAVAAAMISLPDSAFSKGAGIAIVAGSMILLAKALQILDGLKNIWQSFGVLALSLLSISVALEVLNKSLPGAGALVLASVGITLLATSLKILDTVDPTSFIKLGAGLLIIIGAAALAQTAAAGMALLSVTLIGIGAGLALVGVGVLALSTGLLALAAGGTGVVLLLTEILSLIPLLVQQLGLGVIAFIEVLGNSAAVIVKSLTAIGSAFLDSIIELLPKVTELIGELLDAGLTVITEWFPKIVDVGVQLVLEFLKGVEEATPELIDRAFTMAITFMDSLSAAIDAHTDELWASFKNLFLTVLKKIGILLLEEGKKIYEYGFKLGMKLREGIDSIKDKIKQAFVEKIEAVKAWFAQKWEDFKNIGANLIEGLKQGILSIPIVGTIANIGSNIISKFKSVLGIASPSKVFYKYGVYICEGLAKGLEKGSKYVKKALKKVISIFDINGTLITFNNTTMKETVKELDKIIEGSVKKYEWGVGIITQYLNDFTKAKRKSDGTFKKSTTIYKHASKMVGNLAVELYKTSDAYKDAKKTVQAYNKVIQKEQAQLDKLKKKRKQLQQDLKESNEKIKKLEKERKTASKKRQKEIDKELEKEKKNRDKIKNKLKDNEKDIDTTLDNIKQLNKALKKELKDIANGPKEAIKEYKKALKEMVDASSNLLELAITNHANLFEKYEKQEEISAQTLLQNMRSQIVGVKEWQDDIDALAKKGLDKGLIERLREMGPEGAKYVKAFLSMTKEEIQKANLMYQAEGELISEQLLDDARAKMKAIKEWSNNITLLAQRGLGYDFLKDLIDKGYESADYVQALVDMSDEQLEEMSKLYVQQDKLPTSVANNLLAALSLALENDDSGIIKGIGDTTDAISKVLEMSFDDLSNTGTEVVTALADGVKSSEEVMMEASKLIGNSTINTFREYFNTENGMTIGVEMTNGIVTGIVTGTEAVQTAALGLSEAIDEIVGDSDEITDVGKTIDVSLADGVRSYKDVVIESVKDLTTEIKKTLIDFVKDIDNYFNDEKRLPIITPRLELTGVGDEVTRINGLLNENRVGLNGEAAADGIIQNGTNITFTQNNYSPKELSRIEIYRQTRNLLSPVKGLVTV